MASIGVDLDDEPSEYFLMQQKSRESAKAFFISTNSEDRFLDSKRQEDFLWWWN